MPQVDNYIKILPGEVDILRFDQFARLERQIVDPDLGWPKDIKTLDLHVIELNGQAVNSVLSITSTTLISKLEPYLVGDAYKMYRFTLTRDVGKNAPPRVVSVQPV